jgi:hypothetical protein
MDKQSTVDVEVLTPVRNGGPEPIGVGEVVAMDQRQAVQLEQIGAVRILTDVFDLPTIGLRDTPLKIDSSVPIDRVSVYYYNLAGKQRHLGDFASLDDAAEAFAPIDEEMSAVSKSFADRLEAAERLAEERLAEIERLKAASAADDVVGDAAVTGLSGDATEQLTTEILGDAGGGSGPITPVEIVPPPPVTMDMRRDELREIARAEGIVFDDNDTKAELVRKISAGRLTAQAAA